MSVILTHRWRGLALAAYIGKRCRIVSRVGRTVRVMFHDGLIVTAHPFCVTYATPDHKLIEGATPTLRRRIASMTVGRNPAKCWRWTGSTARKRGCERPKVRIGGAVSRVMSVARVLLVLRDRVPLVDRDDAKLEAGHTCHHFWCVNPNHLEWVTRSENELAKYEKKRFDEFAAEVDALAEVAS